MTLIYVNILCDFSLNFYFVRSPSSSSQHVTVAIGRRQDVDVRVGRPQQEVVIDAAEIDATTRAVVLVVVVVRMVVTVMVQTVGRAQQGIPVEPRNITN